MPWLHLQSFLMILFFFLSTPSHAQIKIVTTTPDLAAITQTIGGQHITVTSIAKGYQDPHYIQAKPSYMRTLNRADLLIYNGC